MKVVLKSMIFFVLSFFAIGQSKAEEQIHWDELSNHAGLTVIGQKSPDEYSVDVGWDGDAIYFIRSKILLTESEAEALITSKTQLLYPWKKNLSERVWKSTVDFIFTESETVNVDALEFDDPSVALFTDGVGFVRLYILKHEDGRYNLYYFFNKKF